MGSTSEEAIVRCGTTKGNITLRLIREWSPNGYDRAVELFERHFYDDSHFFRAVPNFLVQFGISYSKDKDLQKLSKKRIQDDPKHDPPIEFHPGIISYAGSGPNSRTSQLFISYGSAPSLGTQLWETPIGKVIEGMEAAKQFYSYGDMPPWGKGPVQGKIYGGPQYIEEGFPLIDKFLTCSVTRTSDSNIGGNAAAIASEDGDDDKSKSKDTDDDKPKSEDADDETDPKEDAGEKQDDPMVGTEVPLGKGKSNVKQGGLRSVANNGKFYALPQAEVERQLMKSSFLGGRINTDSYAFPGAVICVMVILSVLMRGRRKDNCKEN